MPILERHAARDARAPPPLRSRMSYTLPLLPLVQVIATVEKTTTEVVRLRKKQPSYRRFFS